MKLVDRFNHKQRQLLLWHLRDIDILDIKEMGDGCRLNLSVLPLSLLKTIKKITDLIETY